jgi:hypothetical protein
MGLRPGKQEVGLYEDVNERFLKLEGELENQEAMASLGEFLYHNIKLTTQLLTGMRLAPYQVLMIKSWFMRNFSLNVWGRGCSKSTLAGIFAILYCIFNKESNVLIVSSNFRSSRRILENLEKMAKHPKGKLLKALFDGEMSRRNDVFSWKLFNQSTITCVPLSNGDGLRGLRANVLIVDEALLVSKEIITTILMPFLVASGGITEKLAYREEEDKRVASGELKEEDRKIFKSTSKLILLSSASFKFEYLYEIYEDYLRKIAGKINQEDEKKKLEEKQTFPGTYLVTQLSYKVVPPDLLDKAILEEATGGTTSEQTVLREYEAQFVDGSEGYFSPKKMELCTIPDGMEPTTETKGEEGYEYILAIDPSNSSSDSGDHFAMSVIKIVGNEKQEKVGLLVHSYAEAGANFKDNVLYFLYILQAFNIVYIISDTTQGDSFDFINAANETPLFKDQKIELRPIDAEFGKEDQAKVLEQIKKSYNREARRIVQKQSFNSNFLRSANEYLQYCIDYKKVLFSSRASAIGNKAASMGFVGLNKVLSTHESFKGVSIYEFVEHQDHLVRLTKKECSLIEVKQNAMGSQSFDLPQSMKRSESPTRPRKDNYSTLMMGMWALKLYLESKDLKTDRWGNDVLPELF